MLSNERKQRILIKTASAGATLKGGSKTVWEGLKTMAGGGKEAVTAGQGWLGKTLSGSGITAAKGERKALQEGLSHLTSQKGARAALGSKMDDAAWAE